MEQQHYQPAPPSRSGGNNTAPVLGSIGGGCAVLIGLILLIAFFLPWQVGYDGDESAFDTVTEDLGTDNTLGEMLYKLVFGSTALAGCGSVLFGLGLAAGSFAARRDAAFRSWMATSIGGMVILAAFMPCFLLSFALLGDATEDIKVGVWITLGGAALLVIPALIGLVSAFMSQRAR